MAISTKQLGSYVLLLLLAVGCGGESGPPTAHLQGTVTIGGKPIPADAIAMISFSPHDTKLGPGATAEIANGKYDCPKVPLGPVTVFFNITQASGPEIEIRGRKSRETVSLTPPKYGAGTPLDVSGDNAAQDFDLTP
jgi:hypothetical protein